MNGDDSGEASPFDYASSNNDNTASPKSDLLGSETSKKQPNNDSVEQQPNDGDQFNGNKQGSSAEGGWTCEKCNDNNPASKSRCESCLVWKDGKKKKIENNNSLLTYGLGYASNNTLSAYHGSGSASLNNAVSLDNNILMGGGDGSGELQCHFFGQFMQSSLTTQHDSATPKDGGRMSNNNTLSMYGGSGFASFATNVSLVDNNNVMAGGGSSGGGEVQCHFFSGSTNYSLSTTAAVSTTQPSTPTKQLALPLGKRSLGERSPLTQLNSVTNNHPFSPQRDGKENNLKKDEDDEDDDNKVDTSNNEIKEDENNIDDVDMEGWKDSKLLQKSDNGGIFSHIDALDEEDFFLSTESTEITHGQSKGSYTTPHLDIGRNFYFSLDPKAQYKVMNPRNMATQCGLLFHLVGDPRHGELMFCATSICGKEKVFDKLRNEVIRRRYVDNSVFGTIRGDNSRIVISNIKKGGVLVLGGFVRVVLREMLSAENDAKWEPGIVNQELWARSNTLYDDSKSKDLIYYTFEQVNNGTSNTLLGSWTFNYMKAEDTRRQDRVDAVQFTMNLLRTNGITPGHTLPTLNKETTKEGHTLKGTIIASHDAEDETDLKEKVSNGFTLDGQEWLNQNKVVIPKHHVYEEIGSSLRYIDVTDQGNTGILGLCGAKRVGKTKRYPVHLAAEVNQALTVANIAVAGKRFLKWAQTHDPAGRATWVYNNTTFVITVNKI